MEIIRNDDGTLVVPVENRALGTTMTTTPTTHRPRRGTRVLHPGEGGYDEALAEWDAQQNPDRGRSRLDAEGP